MSAHTPGPWVARLSPPKVIRLKREHWLIGRANDPATGVAIVFGDDDANAQAIATLPDLLALAHQYASECAECGGTGFASHKGTQRCEQCSDIWQVIDKAEGRS